MKDEAFKNVSLTSHKGRIITLLQVDSPAGYICRVTRSQVYTVPDTIAGVGSEMLKIFILVWKAKVSHNHVYPENLCI